MVKCMGEECVHAFLCVVVFSVSVAVIVKSTAQHSDGGVYI